MTVALRLDLKLDSRNFGRTAWNKGLTVDTDERVFNSAVIAKAGMGPITVDVLDPLKEFERKKKISISMKRSGISGGYRENAGRSKKIKVVDSFGVETTLQSTYELECSKILNNMGVKWSRPKAMKYGNRNYFADFYLPEYDVYLDPKNNYKAKLDAEKIASVIKENNVKLFVLLKEQITEQYIGLLIQR